ncbi:2-alkenal reductase [Cellvibrio mixtus]|jgi:S1-C subfamily serine protease|uniref:2-alkenal reductase n=1 Tax=Cellvibrio mixtus TaxID=39650 RepID=A0A266QET6_9GAMM|nr:trypsin-like peptidase domain-containing protein [Cellvibrio mixtus]OZY87871.1 2-alkenal reductase [Cellvibrio mixtus]
MTLWRWLLVVLMSGASALSAVANAFSTDDERNSMEVFDAARPSVVFVTNQQLARNPYSFDLVTVPRGSGTGFVWDERGYIVTNYHVVEGARQITITLQDQSNWPAEVVGLAPERDLAVLRIKAPAQQLKALPLGDSSDLRVGRKVLAIGNPFGLDATLTTGVVSALGREIESPNQRKITNVIQTDAAINPGNSGGPLLSSEGKLIGVNTMIYSPSGASAGIGFAIPVNTVKEVVPELIKHGRIVRPVLGVAVAPDHWAQQIGIQGVPILRVEPNSAAAKAGLQGAKRNSWGQISLGDVIVAIEDYPVTNDDQLLSALEHYKPGDQVTVSVVRDGKLLTHKLRLTAPQ